MYNYVTFGEMLTVHIRGLFNKSVASHRKSLNCEILLFWLEIMSIMINIYVNFIVQYLFILKSQNFIIGRGQASSEIGK